MSDIPTDKEIDSILESVYSNPDDDLAISLSYEYMKSVGVSDEFIKNNIVDEDYE